MPCGCLLQSKHSSADYSEKSPEIRNMPSIPIMIPCIQSRDIYWICGLLSTLVAPIDIAVSDTRPSLVLELGWLMKRETEAE